MPYKIKSSDDNKIVLARTLPWQNVLGIMVVAVFMMLIAVAMNLGIFENSVVIQVTRILAPLFSIVFFLLGIQQLKQSKQTPLYITFDNTQGIATIELSGDGSPTGYIRYDEITNFDLYIESRRSRSSNSARTTYRYYVYIKKKDGGRWYLTNLTSNNRAQAILSELNTKVNLTKPATIQTRTDLSENITREDLMDKTTISWQNKVTLWPILYLGLFGIIFYVVASTFYREGNTQDLDGGSFFALVFFLGFFAMVMLYNLFTVYKDATTRYAVSINKKDLSYFEYGNNPEHAKKIKTLPLNEIHSISYTFSPPTGKNAKDGIQIMNHKQFADTQNQPAGFLQAINQMLQRRTAPILLNIKSMNAVESLQLENWLQETIKKKSNQEVI